MSADHQDDFHLYVLGALGVIPPHPVSDATIQCVMRRGEPPSGFDELVAAGYGGVMTPLKSTLVDEVADIPEDSPPLPFTLRDDRTLPELVSLSSTDDFIALNGVIHGYGLGRDNSPEITAAVKTIRICMNDAHQFMPRLIQLMTDAMAIEDVSFRQKQTGVVCSGLRHIIIDSPSVAAREIVDGFMKDIEKQPLAWKAATWKKVGKRRLVLALPATPEGQLDLAREGKVLLATPTTPLWKRASSRTIKYKKWFTRGARRVVS
ncbi:hypothetical protein EV715DRAFT_290775 [Schizophyllum commune]